MGIAESNTLREYSQFRREVESATGRSNLPENISGRKEAAFVTVGHNKKKGERKRIINDIQLLKFFLIEKSIFVVKITTRYK